MDCSHLSEADARTIVSIPYSGHVKNYMLDNLSYIVTVYSWHQFVKSNFTHVNDLKDYLTDIALIEQKYTFLGEML